MVKKFNNNNKFIKGTKPVLTPADKSKLTSVVAAFKKSRSPAFLPVHGGLTFSKTENNTMQRGRALAADKYIFAPRQRQNLASELFGSPQRALRGGGNIWAKNDILPRTGHDAYHGSYFNFIGLKKVNLIGFGKQMEARGDTLFEKWYSGAVKVSMLGNKLRKKHHYADSRVLFKKKEASIDFYPYYYREKFAYSRKFSRRMGAIDRFFARAFAKFRLGAVKEALRRGNLRAYWTSYAGWFQTMGLESDVTSEKTFKVGSRYLAVRNYDRSGISIRKRRLKDYEIEFYKDVKAGKRPYIDNEYRKEAQRKELIFDAWSYPGHTGVGRDEKVESADFRLSNLTYITGVMSDYHMSRIFIGPFYKFLRRAFTSVKRVMARTEKNKRPQKRKIGAKKLKISSRLARSIFYIASNSVAKAVHSRRDSPFLSTRHLMYNLANPFADDAENPAVNYHSLRANIMLSRHMFLNRRGRRMRVAAVREKTKQLTEWHKRFLYRWLDMERYVEVLDNKSKLVGLKKQSNGGHFDFASNRDFRQKKNEIRYASQNMPFWALSLSKGSRWDRIFKPVFEPKIMNMHDKPYLYALDPLFSESAIRGGAPYIFKKLNSLSARHSTVKVVTQLLFSPLLRECKKSIIAGPKSARGVSMFDFNSAVKFLMERYVVSTTREYKDLTSVFGLTITNTAELKFVDNDLIDEKGSVIEVVNEYGAPVYYKKLVKGKITEEKNGLELVSSSYLDKYGWPTEFNKTYEEFWKTYPSSLTQEVISYPDIAGIKSMKNLDYIPRRFLLANELSDTNFTSYYSCNKRAFTRLIIDAFSLFTEGGGINKNAAPLFYSEIARGKNLNIFARAVKYVRLSRALRKKRWDFREKRTFFKLTRASLRLGLAIMRSKFIFKKEWIEIQNKYGVVARNRIFGLALIMFFKETGSKISRLSLVKSLTSTKKGSLVSYRTRRLFAKHFDFARKAFMDHVASSGVLERFGSSLQISSRVGNLLATRVMRKYLDPSGALVYTQRMLIDKLAEKKYSRIFESFYPKWVLMDEDSFSDPRHHISRGYFLKAFKNKPLIYKHYGHYMAEYMHTKRITEMLKTTYLFPDAASKRIGAPISSFLAGLSEPKEITLFKKKPDTMGRSRTIYYVQKKTWYGRKFNKAYRIVRFHIPFYNLSTRMVSEHIVNKHMFQQHGRRVSNRRSFKLKLFLRHIMRREHDMSSTSLYRRWRSIKETKRKWFTYYKMFEGGLANYLVLCNLVNDKETAASLVEGGLVYVNTFVCVNKSYLVSPGDVITINNEAYWTILCEKITAYLRRYLNDGDGPSNFKRKFLADTMSIVREIASRNVLTTLAGSQTGDLPVNDSANDSDNESDAGTIFADPSEARLFESNKYLDTLIEEKEWDDALKQWFEDWEKGIKYPFVPPKKKVRRTPAADQSGLIIENVFSADTCKYDLSFAEGTNQRVAMAKGHVSKYLKDLNNSLRQDGRFYYRFHNSVLVLRHPDSVHEMFAVSKQRKTDLYNPSVLKQFIYPRFWH